jgi:hypothetical protein
MSDSEIGEEYERELARVVERVRTMPLTKLATCSDDVFALCCALADLSQAAGSGLAGSRALPRLGDHGLPDQLQVLGMELAATGENTQIARGLELLVDMRKALP